MRSRKVEEVLAECEGLLDRGVHELVLIGQDLGSYGLDLSRPPEADRAHEAVPGEGRLLPELLAALSSLRGDFRVRTLYIHPDNFPEAILPVMASDGRLLPYFDLPFQHASRRILAAMNRRGSADAYLELLARIRRALPEAVFRSTFLLGFPGETDEDFAELRDFQEKARLDWLGAFAYSREEGTAAYAMRGAVSRRTVAARKREIEEAQERITRENLERFVGRDFTVLVEEEVAPVESGTAPRGGASGPARDAEEGEEFSLGRAWMQAPDVDGLTVLRGRRRPGELVGARILAVTGVDFDAAILR